MVTAYVVILIFLSFVQILTIVMIHHFSTELQKHMADHSRHLRDLFDIIDGNRAMNTPKHGFQYGRIYSGKAPEEDQNTDQKADN
jgi:hypothetical protein